MKLLHKFLYVGILLLGFITTAQSALIANGDFTADTDTGLDWLDLDFSLGLSLNQVNAELGAGGLFEGYQVATLDQAQMFLTNAGWIGAFDSSNNLNMGFVANFKNLTTSFTNDPFGDLEGLTDDPTTNHGLVSFTDDPGTNITSYSLTGQISPGFSQQDTGTFLYRATVVPVPASLWLFGSGLLVLVGFVRRGVKS